MITFFPWFLSGGTWDSSPETQMFKDLLDDIRLVDEADDAPFEFPQGGELVEPHPSLGFGTSKGGSVS